MKIMLTYSCVAFWTFIIILQIIIPLSLYVTIELTKLSQVRQLFFSLIPVLKYPNIFEKIASFFDKKDRIWTPTH